MPFGDPAIVCPCGARGLLGHRRRRHRTGPAAGPPGAARPRRVRPAGDHHGRTRARPSAPPSAVGRAALGRGIAGLVNGIDADLVTLGGLGVDLLAAAPDDLDAAYRAGLMAYRRDDPPPIAPAALGDDGPIAGAAEEAWSALLVTLA